MARHNPDILDEFPSLRRPVRWTRVAMSFERLVGAYWPFLVFVALVLCAAALGAAEIVPTRWQVFLKPGVVGIGLAFLLFGLLRYQPPSRAAALNRIDASLPGQPIAAVRDNLALGASDLETRKIWRVHLDRMAAGLRNARMQPPRLELRFADPFAFRLLGMLALLVAVLFGQPDKLRSGLATPLSPGQQATGPSWEGWIEPPSYTGKPTLYLADLTDEKIVLPLGSRVTIRLYGDLGALSVSEDVSGQGHQAVTDPSQNFELRQAGSLSIDGNNGRRWEIAVLADAAPQIDLEGVIEARLSGEWRQPYVAADDYGVTSGFARIELDLPLVDRIHGLRPDPESRGPIELNLPLPFSGDRRDIHGILEEFLVEHPWAGLPVLLTLGANDAAMQVGLSQPEPMMLPARRFFDPAAQAIIEQRRDLLWTRENAARVSQILRAVSYGADDDFRAQTDIERLRQIIRRIEILSRAGHLSPELQDELSKALWDLAVAIEEGNLSDALERLRRAQERLEQAMREGASDEEIEQLTQELREAMQEYLRQLAEQAEPSDQQEGQQGDQLSSEDLDQILERIEELMKEGRMAEAQELLQQLQQMMENMEVQRGQNGEQSPGQQALDGLAETLDEQQRLSDDTFSDFQEQNGDPSQQGQNGEQGQQGQQGQSGQQGQNGQQGQDGEQGRQGNSGADGGEGATRPGGEGGQSREGLAGRQQALRDMLEEQLRNLPGQAGEGTRQSLNEAGRAMRDAEDALRRGDLPGALDEQADALEAMREGMRELSEDMAGEEQQQGQQGQAAGEGGDANRADPLGRQAGNRGQAGTEEELLGRQDVYRRAEELLDELRRRSGERQRSQPELDYLDRLLDRF